MIAVVTRSPSRQAKCDGAVGEKWGGYEIREPVAQNAGTAVSDGVAQKAGGTRFRPLEMNSKVEKV